MNGDYRNDQNNGQNPDQNGQNNQGQYYGQNNQSNFYREQGYGPQGYDRQNPYWNNQNQPVDTVGNSAQTMGIVAIVASLFCSIVGLIFGILAISRAKESMMMMQYETPAAKTGRVCGIVSVIISALSMAGSVISAIVWGAAMM